MKRLYVFYILLIFFTLFACERNDEDIDYLTYEVDGYTVHYMRTNVFSDFMSQQELFEIHSLENLTAYIDAYDERFDFDHVYPEGISFRNHALTYDADFFEDNLLIFVALEEPSGSIRHELMGIDVTENTLNVTVERQVPEVGTDDMAAWHIVIEIPQSDFTFNQSNLIITTKEAKDEIDTSQKKGSVIEPFFWG